MTEEEGSSKGSSRGSSTWSRGLQTNGDGGGTGDRRLVRAVEMGYAEVQGILEENRLLIHEIKENHEAPAADSLSRNIARLRELNTNITRVVDLYADLSFSVPRSARRNATAAQGNANKPAHNDNKPVRPE